MNEAVRSLLNTMIELNETVEKLKKLADELQKRTDRQQRALNALSTYVRQQRK